MSKTIAVIGSNSFTGSHFVDHALSLGYHVHGFSRSPEYHRVLLPYQYRDNAQNFTFHQLDLNNDLGRIVDIIDGLKPSIIANFAAQGEVRSSWRFPLDWYQTNCMAMVAMAEALREKPYLKRYVVSSTPEVYGSSDQPIDETAAFSPSTPYAASKLAGDIHLLNLYRQYEFPVVFTRAANVYGVHQQLYRIIPRTIIYLLSGRTIELHGRGEATRSFIHIRDVAEATWRVVQRGRTGDTYHVAPQGESTTIFRLVSMICGKMGASVDDFATLIDHNFGQDAAYKLDATKIETELNWKPTISLDDGITEMIDWVKLNWSDIQALPHDYIHQK